jgi:hypothetical protein
MTITSGVRDGVAVIVANALLNGLFLLATRILAHCPSEVNGSVVIVGPVSSLSNLMFATAGSADGFAV